MPSELADVFTDQGIPLIQTITIIVTFVTITALMLQIKWNPRYWRWQVPALGYCLHVLVFYFTLFTIGQSTGLGHDFYSSWSSILRLHGILTFATLEWGRVTLERRTNGR